MSRSMISGCIESKGSSLEVGVDKERWVSKAMFAVLTTSNLYLPNIVIEFKSDYRRVGLLMTRVGDAS